jgi:hypothetical protein
VGFRPAARTLRVFRTRPLVMTWALGLRLPVMGRVSVRAVARGHVKHEVAQDIHGALAVLASDGAMTAARRVPGSYCFAPVPAVWCRIRLLSRWTSYG